MKKRGLSPIVTSVLLILMVVGAIGLIWGIIRGAIETTGEEFDSGATCFSVRMDALRCVEGNPFNGEITVFRNAGGPNTPLGFRIVSESNGNVIESGAGEDLLEAEAIPIANNAQFFANDEIWIEARLPNGDYCPRDGASVICSLP